MPGGVSVAAATEAGDVADEDLAGAEGVPVGASAGWFGHPLAVGGADEFTGHLRSVRLRTTAAGAARLAPRVTFAQHCGLDHIAAPYSRLIPANHQPISAIGIIRLTSLFSQSDRHKEDHTGRYGKTKKKASK
jgi:hypothetical protein